MEDCSVYDSSTDNGDRDGSIDVADVVVGGHDHSCVEVGVSDLSNEERRVSDLNSYTILRTEVGSTAHGVTHSSNDMDEIAVYIPPISEVVGLSQPEHYVYRPGRAPHEPSGAGDLDRTYYTLTKFVRLLVNGNPSILFALFGPVQHRTAWGDMLLGVRGSFQNDRTRKAYLGYMQAQRQRITGERGSAGRVRRSPEGGGEIDWKYAMHMVRLGVQGIEYLSTGHISTPSLERDELLAIRSGEVPLEDVLLMAEEREKTLQEMVLPEDPGYEWDQWLALVHRNYWKFWGEL